MKELDPAEVLAIAGGLPPGALLVEVLYRSAPEPLRDPLAPADLESPRAP